MTKIIHKKTILTIPLTMILLAGLIVLINPSNTVVAEGQYYSSGTAGTYVGIAQTVPPVNCNVDPQPIVALVNTNGATTQVLSTIVSDLQGSGFTVREVDITGGVIPPCITKLIITSEAFNRCLTTSFGAVEEAAVVNYVSSGGELLINGEWGTFCGQGTESLIENFVTAANIDANANGPFVANVDFDPLNPATLFAGVGAYQQFAGSHFIDAPGDPAVVVDQGQHPAMIAGPFGSGCVVITGDSNWFSNSVGNANILQQNNRQLANNIFAFLNECADSVEIDIKPASCPNPINTKSKGVLPVAILGTDTFDVSDVDVSTILLEGVAPIRSSTEDVATPFDGDLDNELSCTEDRADGFLDLTLKFKTQEIITAIGPVADGDVLVLELTGGLLDGTSFTAQDIVIIRDKGKP